MSLRSLDCWTGVNADTLALETATVGIAGKIDATLDSAVVITA